MKIATALKFTNAARQVVHIVRREQKFSRPRLTLMTRLMVVTRA